MQNYVRSVHCLLGCTVVQCRVWLGAESMVGALIKRTCRLQLGFKGKCGQFHKREIWKLFIEEAAITIRIYR